MGIRLENIILDIIELILSASFKQSGIKRELLMRASDKIDLLKLLIRLAHETQCINTNKYTLLERNLIEIGKIIGGWIKSI